MRHGRFARFSIFTTRGFPLIVLCAVSCSDVVGPSDPFPLPDVRAYVVGNALANLDANGHFRLPVATAPGDQPIIDLDTAAELTLGFIRTWVTNPNVITIGDVSAKERAERLHGMPIEWDRVALATRIGYYAESHLPVLPDSVPGYVRRHFGPHYFVPIWVDGRHVATVGIAAYATEIWVDSTGRVHKPRFGSGEEFSLHGVPHDQPSGLPASPEWAVRFASDETGARVREVPVLTQPGHNMHPVYGGWQLRLDREVDFIRLVDGIRVRTSSVVVRSHHSIIEDVSRGWYLRLFVAADSQPEHDVVRYFVPGDTEHVLHELEVDIRNEIPVNLHEVRAAKN
jgi:hypothetical protein